MQKQVFSYKNELWVAQIPILYSQILRASFSKSTFHQSVITSSMKLPYLKNVMYDLKTFCTKIELKEEPFRKKQKVNFDRLTQLVHFDVLSHIYYFTLIISGFLTSNLTNYFLAIIFVFVVLGDICTIAISYVGLMCDDESMKREGISAIHHPWQ